MTLYLHSVQCAGAAENLPADTTKSEKSYSLPKGVLAAALTGLLAAFGAATSAGKPDFGRNAISHGADLPHAERSVSAWIVSPSATNHAILGHDMDATKFAALEVDNVEEMSRVFQAVAFDLSQVRQRNISVPRVFLETLPGDFGHTMPVPVRKSHFIRVVLPMILAVNEEIAANRDRLAGLDTLLRGGSEISGLDAAWLQQLATRYDVDLGSMPGNVESHEATLAKLGALKLRVDSVSVSLALAQAIEETGWGRSRFARDGNALFGQRIWKEGGGLVPIQRAEGETFEVRAFDNLMEGVRQYALNINTHRAYRGYRAIRRDYRQAQLPLDGLALSSALTLYSERGSAYIANIKEIIRSNDLRQLETAELVIDEEV